MQLAMMELYKRRDQPMMGVACPWSCRSLCSLRLYWVLGLGGDAQRPRDLWIHELATRSGS